MVLMVLMGLIGLNAAWCSWGVYLLLMVYGAGGAVHSRGPSHST